MNNVERAALCFEEGFSCAQAVFSSCGPQFGLDREMALRVAGAFGGGLAHMGRTCGAVTGALMVIGLEHGKTKVGDDEARETCYGLAREFVKQFEARNGSTICQELVGYNVGIPEEKEMAREQGIFDTLCPKLVRDAVEIVEQIIVAGREGGTQINADER